MEGRKDRTNEPPPGHRHNDAPTTPPRHHLVTVDAERVGALQAAEERLQLGQARVRAAVRRVDVQPDLACGVMTMSRWWHTRAHTHTETRTHIAPDTLAGAAPAVAAGGSSEAISSHAAAISGTSSNAQLVVVPEGRRHGFKMAYRDDGQCRVVARARTPPPPRRTTATRTTKRESNGRASRGRATTAAARVRARTERRDDGDGREAARHVVARGRAQRRGAQLEAVRRRGGQRAVREPEDHARLWCNVVYYNVMPCTVMSRCAAGGMRTRGPCTPFVGRCHGDIRVMAWWCAQDR